MFTPVMKAEDLWSLDDLNLNKRVHNYVAKKNLPLEEVVRIGRIADLQLMLQKSTRGYSDIVLPKWQLELRDALDELLFIRHDIDVRTLGVGTLYRDLSRGIPLGLMTFSVEEITNEQYEAASVVTEDDVRRTLKGLRERIVLTDRQEAFIMLYYGVGGLKMSLEETAKELHCTKAEVKHMWGKILHKFSRL